MLTSRKLLPDFYTTMIIFITGGARSGKSKYAQEMALSLCPTPVHVATAKHWGGDFEEVLALLKEKKLGKDDIRFFLGYSGWSEGQLSGELEGKSWITREANKPLVFNLNTHQIWKAALKDLGGEYSQMINYPIDPQLN